MRALPPALPVGRVYRYRIPPPSLAHRHLFDAAQRKLALCLMPRPPLGTGAEAWPIATVMVTPTTLSPTVPGFGSASAHCAKLSEARAIERSSRIFHSAKVAGNCVNSTRYARCDMAPLFLLHGGGTTSAMWARSVLEWSAHFRVIAADIIGEPGFSAPVRPPFSRTPTRGGSMICWTPRAW